MERLLTTELRGHVYTLMSTPQFEEVSQRLAALSVPVSEIIDLLEDQLVDFFDLDSREEDDDAEEWMQSIKMFNYWLWSINLNYLLFLLFVSFISTDSTPLIVIFPLFINEVTWFLSMGIFQATIIAKPKKIFFLFFHNFSP